MLPVYRFTPGTDRYSQGILGTNERERRAVHHDRLRGSGTYFQSAFLAYTAPKWLSLIFPADHPDHSLFVEEGEKSQAFKEPVSEESKKMLTEHFEKFTAAAEGKALLYFQNKREFLDFLTKIGIETEGATRRYRLPEICRLCHSVRRFASPNRRC